MAGIWALKGSRCSMSLRTSLAQVSVSLAVFSSSSLSLTGKYQAQWSQETNLSTFDGWCCHEWPWWSDWCLTSALPEPGTALWGSPWCWFSWQDTPQNWLRGLQTNLCAVCRCWSCRSRCSCLLILTKKFFFLSLENFSRKSILKCRGLARPLQGEWCNSSSNLLLKGLL